jgi:peroxiredoxin
MTSSRLESEMDMNRFLMIVFAAALAWAPVQADAGEQRQQIHATAEQAQPLMPGMEAPSFTVRDANGNAVQFDAAALERPLVLTFYRGGWCPYCNLHLSEMRHAERQLRDLGFDIWFVSIDRPDVLRPSLGEPDIGYTLLSDSGLDATRAFGIAFRVDDKTNARYLGNGIDLEAISGETHHALPVPSTFMIGTDGRINFAYSNPVYTVRLHPDVLLAAANAYLAEEDGRLQRARKAQREARK